MTAREKAIEAAARAIIGSHVPLTGTQARRSMEISHRRDAKAAVNAAAPFIESALLDRIEEAVTGLRDEETSEPDVGDRGTHGTIYALDAVLAILTEIREGAGQ